LIAAVALSLFVLALLYASVGHGGASGYLAVLALSGEPADQVRATALLLNIIVSPLSLVHFRRRACFRGKLLLPFAAAAVPSAMLAGSLGSLDQRAFGFGVSIVLLFAAWRMALPPLTRVSSELRDEPPLAVSLAVGACIGAVSGLIGVGGGIFLSPLLILRRWATPKETAAVSAAFILLSSSAGLTGLAIQFGAPPIVLHESGTYAATAFFGGWIGARFAADRFSAVQLRRTLAFVLFLAAIKLAINAW